MSIWLGAAKQFLRCGRGCLASCNVKEAPGFLLHMASLTVSSKDCVYRNVLRRHRSASGRSRTVCRLFCTSTESTPPRHPDDRKEPCGHLPRIDFPGFFTPRPETGRRTRSSWGSCAPVGKESRRGADRDDVTFGVFLPPGHAADLVTINEAGTFLTIRCPPSFV